MILSNCKECGNDLKDSNYNYCIECGKSLIEIKKRNNLIDGHKSINQNIVPNLYILDKIKSIFFDLDFNLIKSLDFSRILLSVGISIFFMFFVIVSIRTLLTNEVSFSTKDFYEIICDILLLHSPTISIT